jgi:hypothetical protein
MAAWSGSRFNKEIPVDCSAVHRGSKGRIQFLTMKTVWERGSGKEIFIKEGDK